MSVTIILFTAGILIMAGVVARWAVSDIDDEPCGFSEKADKEYK